MAPSILSSGVLLAAVYVVYWKISSYLSNKQFERFAEENGCKPPPVAPGDHGFARLRRILKMTESGEDLLDDLVAPAHVRAATVYLYGFEGSKVIQTVDPANLQAMLATQFDDFELGKRRYDQFKPMVGKSIFSSDGAFWAHSRAIFRPAFARDNINDLEMTNHAASVLMQALGEPDEKGYTSGDQTMPLLYNFTLDTASDFLFGESVGTQSFKLSTKRGYTEQDLAKAQHQKEAQEFSDSFAVMNQRSAASQSHQEGQKVHEDHHNLGIAEAKKTSLLDNLATQTQDKEEMRNQVTALLLAGRDTTSALLGWSFVRLALHPDTFQKLRDVVLNEFQTDEDLTFAKLKGCRYLQHFLQEILRLHPTVPVNQRNAARDTTLPVGGGPDGKSPVAVRKGQTMFYSVYVMHRRKDLWGEDALEFKPERWEQRYPAWQFLPFNGGPRICLGQQFALTEASFVLVRMLQEFDACEPVDRQSLARMKKGLGLTMWPEDSRVRFHKASA